MMKRRQCPSFVRYPKPVPDRLGVSKPRFRPGVIVEAVLIAFVLLAAWAGFIFLAGIFG